jgi:hypothetical protein
MGYGSTAHNRIVCAAPPNGGLASEKPQSVLRAFVRFFSGTFGAGSMLHCPITRPKRRIQPERYAKWRLNWLNILEKCIDKSILML